MRDEREGRGEGERERELIMIWVGENLIILELHKNNKD